MQINNSQGELTDVSAKENHWCCAAGVLQVEAMAQLGGLVMINTDDGPAGEFFFGGVDKLRWRRVVVPGDVLMMRVEVTKFSKAMGVCKLKAQAWVGSEPACEAELMLIMGR